MKRCPWCQREVPEQAVVCPHADCARAIRSGAAIIPPPPPPPSLLPAQATERSTAVPAPPGPTAATPPRPSTPSPSAVPPGAIPASTPAARHGGVPLGFPAKIAPPPPPASATPPPVVSPPGVASPVAAPKAAIGPPPQVCSPSAVELQGQLEGLRRKVRRGRLRSWLLGCATAAALGLGLFCLGAYYAAAVLSYARLEGIQIERDPVDRNRLALVFRPLSGGTLAFCRADADRQTELLDRIDAGEVGQPQQFVWRVSGLKTGDVIQVTSLDGWRLRTTELTVPEPGASSALSGALSGTEGSGVPLGDGVICGRVINAINKEPVRNAAVRIPGTRLGARTDAEGYFRLLGTPTGKQSIELSADGFSSETLEREVLGGQETLLRVALSPGLEKGQIRIVLTWDNLPKDLDAHLEGPLPEGKRFHVYYHQPGDLKSREFVRLDVDAQDGQGPETITVLGVLPGTYRYFVHDYSNRDNPNSTALARSGAEVKVYHGGQTYRFQAGHEMAGNIWDVCTIEVIPDGAVVKKVDQYRGEKMESLGLYAKRTMANRQQWIANYGGSVISEQAVNEGLQWLARHQAPEGFWSSTCLGGQPHTRCEQGSRCTGEGEPYDMALSGLALLAFQAGGHYYFNNSPHSPGVRKGLDWIVAHQREDGALVAFRSQWRQSSYHQYYMYEHGIATFALADACAAAYACGEPENERYLRALRKAVEFIQHNQHDDGGWRYDNIAKNASDSSVTGWQVLALKSAKEAGVSVDPQCIERVRAFFKKREMNSDGRTGYLGRRLVTEATTGVGMLAKQFLLNEPDAPLVRDAAKYLASYAERKWGDRTARGDDQDYYLWYNCTLGMFQAGGEEWNRWNNLVRDTIVGLQRHGTECVRGSWDPDPKWGGRGGRVYSTALAVLTLETYYRYTAQSEIRAGEFELRTTAPEPPKTPARSDRPGNSSIELPSREAKENDQGESAGKKADAAALRQLMPRDPKRPAAKRKSAGKPAKPKSERSGPELHERIEP